jgi:hypothetical protein
LPLITALDFGIVNSGDVCGGRKFTAENLSARRSWGCAWQARTKIDFYFETSNAHFCRSSSELHRADEIRQSNYKFAAAPALDDFSSSRFGLNVIVVIVKALFPAVSMSRQLSDSSSGYFPYRFCNSRTLIICREGSAAHGDENRARKCSHECGTFAEISALVFITKARRAMNAS